MNSGSLPDPWRSCFELAWEAFGAGSVPVGAVIVDGSGAIVARGRNRRFDREITPLQLANTNLAHAEINAIASLGRADLSDHLLYTNLEPCLLCSTAMAHTRLGRVRYAASDPALTGIDRVPDVVAYVSRRWPIREGPFGGPLSVVSELLNVVHWLRSNPDANYVRVVDEARPELVRVARGLVASSEINVLTQLGPAEAFSRLAEHLSTNGISSRD